MDLSPPRSPNAAVPPADAGAVAEQLAAVVVEAGGVARAMFARGITSWSKHNDSPVTDADIAVDTLLKEKLGALAPDYGWLSEETADVPERLERRRVWIVDPIDGTRAFMAGGPDWAVVAALVEDGRPIAGALFAPVTQELFLAAVGRGATRNGAPIRASNARAVAGARADGPAQWLSRVDRLGTLARVPRIRSLALRIARVATGELDIAIAGPNGNDWDLAAADLLVHEAGGRLTDLDGLQLIYNAPVPRHGALVSTGTGLHPSVTDAARRDED
ncbi:3'(2'),5'-bisphosphate nucleotidase CysQ [Ancylobacter sonchi]|nr:3'(2'),5'-bisphosphate nucleotidase CysQ [Ancylobacter sonchi]